MSATRTSPSNSGGHDRIVGKGRARAAARALVSAAVLSASLGAVLSAWAQGGALGAGQAAASRSTSHPATGRGDAASFGIWTPSAQDTCTKEQHDAFSVIGPDGKRYPTWHPPTGPNGCSFGHEHGRDPRQSAMWSTKQIQRYFYFDANGNQQMDPDEEAVTGIPFGYVNEQLEAYAAAHRAMEMRHEDHVGHKIDWVNGEPDLATHRMSADPTGGAWVGALGGGVVVQDTGVRCSYLAKVHQGVSTDDAFRNNLHEVVYFNDCRHPDPKYNQQISVAQLAVFNRAGGFTKFMPLCGIARRSDPRDFVNLDAASPRVQPAGGDREIVSRDCIEVGFLVPPGQWSGILYEAWTTSLALSRGDGRRIIEQINLLFDVQDAIRYFYPEELKAERGYANPAAGTNRGFTIDLCYDMSLADSARQYRGGLCDSATDYGRVRDITWDDRRSAFRGLHRGMYFAPAVIENAGGPETWFTDPFGEHAAKSPFAGSVAQRVTSKRQNYRTLIGNRPIDPRVADRLHDDGGRTVHAPN